MIRRTLFHRGINRGSLTLLYCCLLVCVCCNPTFALPPLGHTPINPAFSNLEIIDGTAYISAPGGVRTVSSDGNLGLIPLSHPTLGPLFSVTRVVKALDDDLYVAANFGDFNNPLGAALFRLNEPSTPIVTWDGSYRVQGVDRELRSFGNLTSPMTGFFEATRFLVDGTIEPMAYPAGSDSNDSHTFLRASTLSGFSIGDAGVPGTLGDAPGLWTPDGVFQFVDSLGTSSSIRDRADLQGINLGWDTTFPHVGYGLGNEIEIKDQFGVKINVLGGSVIVSQSEFAVVDPIGSATYAYYPGIVPDHPDRALPLLDIFPELASIDIGAVTSLSAVDGYIYMTLNGDDGRFLFGARDPSVVPEPTTRALAFIGATAILWLFRSGFQRGRQGA